MGTESCYMLMRDMTIIQPAGFGDILFCLKIGKHFIDQGYQVNWPVIPQYKSAIDCFENWGINFCEALIAQDKTLNLQNSSHIHRDKRIMEAKYAMTGIDWQGWQDCVKIKVLPAQDYTGHKKYAFICDTFASPPLEQRIKIPFTDNQGIPTINPQSVKADNPMVYVQALQNATVIHTVDTMWTYLMEVLPLQATDIFIYSRNYGQDGEPSWSETRYLFKKKFNWVHK